MELGLWKENLPSQAWLTGPFNLRQGCRRWMAPAIAAELPLRFGKFRAELFYFRSGFLVFFPDANQFL